MTTPDLSRPSGTVEDQFYRVLIRYFFDRPGWWYISGESWGICYVKSLVILRQRAQRFREEQGCLHRSRSSYELGVYLPEIISRSLQSAKMFWRQRRLQAG